MQPLNALQAYIAKSGLDAVLLSAQAEIFCFTGCAAENAGTICAVIKPDTVELIAPDGTDVPAAATLRTYGIYGFERVENAGHGMRTHLAQALEGCRRVGFTSDKPGGVSCHGLQCTWADITAAVNDLMDCKPASFLPLFEKALSLNANAYTRVAQTLRCGMSELELHGIVTASYLRDSGHPVQFTGDYLSGERCGEISGGPTDRIIRTGDAVIVDALVALDGAHADTTRTFFMGAPDLRRRKAYAAVERALACGEAALRPDVAASAVYRAVAASLEADGYPVLPHHAGHGVGYAWYERPYFIPPCDQILRAGMLVTLEPGIYDGRGGVRLENNYRITEDGVENLLHSPTAIEQYIITG